MKHFSDLRKMALLVTALSLLLADSPPYAFGQDAAQKGKPETSGAMNVARIPEKIQDKAPAVPPDKAGKAVAGPTGSDARGKILWATRMIATTSGARGPAGVLGAPGSPRTHFIGLAAEASVWVTDFTDIEIYGDLASLLGGSLAGDRPTPEQVRNAQIIAWEGNGFGSTRAGGWESSIWLFTDRGTSYAETFAETTGRGTFAESGTNQAMFLTGTIRCGEYWRFFHGAAPGASDCLSPDGSDFVSWILITLPSHINVFSPYFAIWASGTNHLLSTDPLLPHLAEGKPEPTGIGILAYR